MSSSIQEVLKLSKEAASFHSLDSHQECTNRLGLLRQKLLEIDRNELDSSVIWNLTAIIKGEQLKWTDSSTALTDSLETAAQSLFCLRNAFVNCSRIQLMVAETDELREILLACVKWVFYSGQGKSFDTAGSEEKEDGCGIPSLYAKTSQLAVASITCLGNLVAANTETRKIMWPYLQPQIREMLGYHEESVSYLSAMVIFNCILEKRLREELCKCDEIDNVISDLLTLYMNGETSSEKALCFVLYTLEVLLCCEGQVNNTWKGLSGKQQLLVLDILSSILEGKSGSKCGSLSPSSVTYLLGIFKNEADKILRTLTRELEDHTALVIVRLLNFLCSLAASEYWSPTLREDTSLLITVVSLLQCLNDIGGVEENGFSRLGLDELPDEEKLVEAETHPAYGFKRDMIRLIANLVYRHKANQDTVREMGGITLVLESSQFDARNPAIKEVAIYAIRNLLEGNLENQEIVKKLEYRGSAENQAMRISQEDEMVVIQGSSNSDDQL
ncbi:hypothetical protein SK128_009820 [Halocaridina rubra]|uniref:Ataxin-10 n=1 Tax=Halocaridina rubra TaxID=373956 RepID=A0AAN9AD42_HALRR